MKKKFQVQAKSPIDDEIAKILEIMLNKWIEEHPEQYCKVVKKRVDSLFKDILYDAMAGG